MKVASGFGISAALTGLAIMASPAALADDAGWYVGVNAGAARAKIDDPRIINDLLTSGFSVTSFRNDEHHFGFKAFGGYEFNRYISLEGGYFDLGRFGFTTVTAPPGTLRGDIRIRGANLDLVGSLPLGERLSVFVRGGLNYAQSKDSFAGTGAVIVANPSPHRWASNYKFGFGGQFNFSSAVGMRLEAERYRVDDAVGNKGDVDLYSAGLVFRFGRGEAMPVEAAPEPAPPPVVEQAPAPIPPAPPPKPPTPRVLEHVNFSADSLFGFGKDTVRPAGKRALDAFAANLRGSQFEIITVTGHTDRLGSHAYNQKLSQRRADSVKEYLVESAGIPENKISARGVDGQDPVMKPEECRGTKRTARLIACLQPDRRVEIEVDGTHMQAAPAPEDAQSP